ncbi:MAG: response regulator transcription factor [Formivibrio sp.]|nr:response regulator transcription factor [Formivibrio sp.]
MSANPIILVAGDDYLFRYWQAALLPNPVERAGLDWQAPEGSRVLIDAAVPGIPAWQSPWWQEKTARYRIIFTNTAPDDAQAFAALQAGCYGYCHAATPLETLKQVLDVVTSGGIWAGQALVQRLLAAVNRIPAVASSTDPLTLLSTREREVARLAARGAANKVIARELDITERTVKAHLSSAFEKLQVEDRVQLALLLNGVR